MKKTWFIPGLLALGILLPTGAAIAGPAADALGACMADSTTGKERKTLARWIFLAMAAHPELRDLASSTEQARDQTDAAVGGIVTKLLADSCAVQAREAIKLESGAGLESAFGVLGKLAMRELMSDDAVKASISGFEKYIDKQRLDASLGQP